MRANVFNNKNKDRNSPPPSISSLSSPLLITSKPEPGAQRFIEFKDSISLGAKTSRAAATRLLKNLHLAEECPDPSNIAVQVDGWSCGIWVLRWIEREIRAIMGEPRMPPTSIHEVLRRGNDFIIKLQPKAKAKAKAKAEPVTAAKPKELKIYELGHETFDLAIKAGLECTKCLPTKHGTKGCRSCMGEHFELIRQRSRK